MQADILKCLGHEAHTAIIIRHMIAIQPESGPQPGPPPVDPFLKVTHDTFDGVKVIVYQPTSVKNSLRGGLVYMYAGGWALGSAGESSGGTLAAAVTLKFRNRNWRPRIKLQVLLYPPLQTIDFMTPSNRKNACLGDLDQAYIRDFWLWYAFGNVTDSHVVGRTKPLPRPATADCCRGQLSLTQARSQANDDSPSHVVGQTNLSGPKSSRHSLTSISLLSCHVT
ncbi:hypothetical protein NP493_1690g00022 [Ridgeia piscesae]|uniref:Alpha/beta hydrolase fold-3 domain-containing protein n=1 Tax=Ridgeia piscesae TaxID=27915 RepID=A0AAD9JV95_RIDPI|nr:hypothetical protein NP493_1690g00022 [Ridgeia piscesae]